jgi:hypothetical protein
MSAWRNRIRSLPLQKIISKKTIARLVAIRLAVQKIAKVYIVKFKKTLVYKKIALKLSKVSERNKAIGILVFMVVILLGGYYLLLAHPNKTTNSSAPTPTPELSKGAPNYTTVLPIGKSIESLGGWTRVSPPKASPVYTYIDKVENVQINVSEQPLPDNFKSDSAGQLGQLAQNEKAMQKITVEGNTVYIGTSSQGPQSIFFVKNNLLILIKSDSTISDNSWVKYINSLQ